MNEATTARRPGSAGAAVTNVLRVAGAPGPRVQWVGERMRTVRVRSAMKAVPEGISSMATLEEAEERMDAEGVNWLPVVDNDRLVGLITRLDLRLALVTHPGPTSRAL